MSVLRNISHLLAALFNDRADFQRRWRGEPQNRWQGQWVSQANGHRGELKCLLTKAGPDQYQATFYAVFAKFLSVAYTVPLHGRRDGAKLRLEGQADLGKLAGGIYHYDGEMDDASFLCAYRCAYDHGMFQLAPVRL